LEKTIAAARDGWSSEGELCGQQEQEMYTSGSHSSMTLCTDTRDAFLAGNARAVENLEMLDSRC
jgi:hypothetical protein